MSDWRVPAAICLLGVVSYALRAGGFLAAGLVREHGTAARFLRLAPGNLFVGFIAAACMQGGLPGMLGCAAALLAMIVTGAEWLALLAGFCAAVMAALLL